jgi:hypothetical protein
MQATIITGVYATSAVQCYEWLWKSLLMLTSKYGNDELTVHGEYDVMTGMQQDLKRGRPGARPPVGKSTVQ